eukprot:15369391-Alexandrium_andersonii.AAC.1
MSSTSATSPGSPLQHTARTSYFWAYPAIAAVKRQTSLFCIGAMVEPSRSSSSAQAKYAPSQHGSCSSAAR